MQHQRTNKFQSNYTGSSIQLGEYAHRDASRNDITYNLPQSTNTPPGRQTVAEQDRRKASEPPRIYLTSAGGSERLNISGYTEESVVSPHSPKLPDWGSNSNISVGSFANHFKSQVELALVNQPQDPSILQHFASATKVTSSSAWSISLGEAPDTPALPDSRVSALTFVEPDYSMRPSMASRAGMKRKAPSMSESSVVRTTTEAGPSTAKRPSLGRTESSRIALMRVQTPHTVEQDSTQPEELAEPVDRHGAASPTPSRSAPKVSVEASSIATGQRIHEIASKLSPILPAGKVFPIRIGSELFQLSGASISSDAPSYFSHYFGEQMLQSGGKASSVKALYIDRDPVTFRDIAMHLQGYHIKPRDGAHFVKLFADAQFYSLPRLTQQLFKSDIFVQVGERHFQIPRDIFSAPGDSPNFFSLGFAHFFCNPNEVPTGGEGQTLLRPPPVLPPAVPNRNGNIFADLLRILQGYDVKIRDEAHRGELLRDARYFHLKGVEQKLLPCEKSFNLGRQKSEIVMRIEDLRQSGVIFIADENMPSLGPPADFSKPATPHSAFGGNIESNGNSGPLGWISYQRPFVDEQASELVLQISGNRESTKLDPNTLRATFYGETRARITSLFQVIANKMGLPATLPLGLMMMKSGGGVAAQPISPANSGVSGDRVRVRLEKESWVEVDGNELEWEEDEDGIVNNGVGAFPLLKGPIGNMMDGDWIITRSLWRLRVDCSPETGKPEVILVVVKMEAVTDARSRNKKRIFLT